MPDRGVSTINVDNRPRGVLYVVGTPIGNLEDISLRALRTLREVALIAAEDTRRTRQLLARYEIDTPLLSYREQNMRAVTPALLARLRESSLALVSDAGMPTISDPGAALIAAVIASGGRVEVVPGPTAAVTALVGSGLPPAPFTFVGFLSRQRGDRLRQLTELAARPETLVFYEAPHRLLDTLEDSIATLGDRPAAVARELTKRHEEIVRGSLSAIRDRFRIETPRGELTIVVAGAPRPLPEHDPSPAIDEELRRAMAEGDAMKEVVARVAAAHGCSRRVVYARWQSLRKERA